NKTICLRQLFWGVVVEDAASLGVLLADLLGLDNVHEKLGIEADHAPLPFDQGLLDGLERALAIIDGVQRLVVVVPAGDDDVGVAALFQHVLQQQAIDEGHIAGEDEHGITLGGLQRSAQAGQRPRAGFGVGSHRQAQEFVGIGIVGGDQGLVAKAGDAGEDVLDHGAAGQRNEALVFAHAAGPAAGLDDNR